MYQYTLQSDNLADLTTWAPRIVQRLRSLPGLVDVSSDQQNKGREARLEIDRATASRLGITPQMIDDVLYDAFGQRQVAINYTLLNQYHLIMEVAPEYWQQPETLKDIYVRGRQWGHGALKRLQPVRAKCHFAGRQPPESVPLGDHLFQFAARENRSGRPLRP